MSELVLAVTRDVLSITLVTSDPLRVSPRVCICCAQQESFSSVVTSVLVVYGRVHADSRLCMRHGSRNIECSSDSAW